VFPHRLLECFPTPSSQKDLPSNCTRERSFLRRIRRFCTTSGVITAHGNWSQGSANHWNRNTTGLLPTTKTIGKPVATLKLVQTSFRRVLFTGPGTALNRSGLAVMRETALNLSSMNDPEVFGLCSLRCMLFVVAPVFLDDSRHSLESLFSFLLFTFSFLFLFMFRLGCQSSLL